MEDQRRSSAGAADRLRLMIQNFRYDCELGNSTTRYCYGDWLQDSKAAPSGSWGALGSKRRMLRCRSCCVSDCQANFADC